MLLILFLIVVLGGGFLVYAFAKIHRPGSTESVAVTFSVPKGASTRQVGSELKEKGLVDNVFLFVAYAMLQDANGKIQAGDYSLDKNMSMGKMLDVLASGEVTRNEKKLTIVEGWNNKLVSAKVDEVGLATEEQFTDALEKEYDFEYGDIGKEFSYEGFLFPDTYQLNATLDAEDIIQRLLSNFESKITDDMRAEMQRRNLSMKDVITLASIVEREVGRASSVQLTPSVLATMQNERETVASIFLNRLEIDMPLQSDATVNYATGKADRRALLSDLENDSPYNTYKNIGLPPGPISNPGINSIRAVIFPAQTDYLYFLNNKEGTAYYGKTLEEHNSNRANYLD